MIDRLKILGFRRLFDIDLPMKPLMVMIGANGAGKSSFMDAVSVLSASAGGELERKLLDMGGLSNVLTRGKTDNLAFEVGASDREQLNYHLQIYLSEYREEHNLDKFRDCLSDVAFYKSLDLSPRSPIRLPQQMRPANSPGHDGGELIPFLYHLREELPESFETIIDTLHAAFPSFEELKFPPVAAGMLTMTWKDKDFEKPIYMHELSDGTLRFLWLASILQSTKPASITMIDEPEVSLHPELLCLLADLFREGSKRTQLIVATHSDRLVRFMRPDEVVVMDIDDDGFATAKWADTMDIDGWLSEYSLDQVWQMGILGGRA